MTTSKQVKELFSAADLATLTGANPPTEEQSAVITAPRGQLLVVAGAGSGKTETIANRLVYWVINAGIVPESILGLTFTRKAAGEMAARFALRLERFASLMESVQNRQQTAEVTAVLKAADFDLDQLRQRFDTLAQRGMTPELLRHPVSVSTYDSYAGTLLTEFGTLVGRESGFTTITDAARYQIMTDVVQSWTGALGVKREGENTEHLIKNLLSLANDTNSHLVDLAEMKQTYRSYLSVAEHLRDSEGSELNGTALRHLNTILNTMEFGRNATGVIQAFNERKQELMMADFSDQTRETVRLVEQLPVVGESQRERFQLVFLDEFQDTSVAQMRFLSGIFRDCAVTAVGDPNQAIYGWRGASAASMEDFGDIFCSDPQQLLTRTLSTSWRNDEVILKVANRISAELTTAPSPGASGKARRNQGLQPSASKPLRARPGASPGIVYGIQTLTDIEQSQAVVNFFRLWQAQRVKLQSEGTPTEKLPTAAILCRAKNAIPNLSEALRRAGIPYQTRGMQGVLEDPGVRLVRAALEVTDDPEKGASLLILLDRYRLGLSDIQAVGRNPHRFTPYQIVMEGGAEVSAEAAMRLEKLRGILTELKENAAFATPLVLTRLAHRLLDLDIEQQLPGSPCQAGAYVEFLNLVRDFGRIPGATLSGFLNWLSAGEQEEASFADLDFEVDNAAVQIITMHAAKGLEWDWVAVPNLNKNTFPSSKGEIWAMRRDVLPYPLRSDRAHLPELELKTQTVLTAKGKVSSKKGLLESYREEAGQYTLREESRLAYVAFTRAKSRLLLGHCWFERQTKTERLPSKFFLVQQDPHQRIFTDADVAGGADGPDVIRQDPSAAPSVQTSGESTAEAQNLLTPFNAETFAQEATRLGIALPSVEWPETEVTSIPEKTENPNQDRFEGGVWPALPWTQTRQDLAHAYQVTEDALASGIFADGVSQDAAEETERRLSQLLHQPQTRLGTGDLLGRISATGMARLAQDSEGYLLQRLRPLPQEPSAAARLGTYMHAWIASQLENEDALIFDAGMEDGFTPDQRKLLHKWQQHYADLELLRRLRRPQVEFDGELYVGEGAGAVIPLRIDAQFEEVQTGKIWILDWKTGRRPTPKDYSQWLHQLGIYRLYWLQAHPQTPAEDIVCAYVFLNEDDPERQLLTLQDILDELGISDYSQDLLVSNLTDRGKEADEVLEKFGY
ncbi:ATP-dependent DNA helicase [uncultured Mobiluncus sp.]|uniref:ATP-dependent DNA helicase n=1 Tax=uncultured Mobiluncus sp. TaxID=293425 RepID=UPI00288BAFDF|nr:ATP-dependent DNA helicase [uncultured Mobiluncus sp.]